MQERFQRSYQNSKCGEAILKAVEDTYGAAIKENAMELT